MRNAVRLCAVIAVVAVGLYLVIVFAVPQPAPPPDCVAPLFENNCGPSAADVLALLFLLLGSLLAALTGLLVVIAGLRVRQGVLGVGLALLIFTILATAILYIVPDAFDAVFFDNSGAYFPGAVPWYIQASPLIIFIMLTLAPLPALFLAPGRPGPGVRSSTSYGEPGSRSPIWPRLALSSVVLAGVSLVVLDRVVEHYAVVGIGPAWPVLASIVGFGVLWWVAWLLFMGSLLPRRSASVS
ncbi:MAG: hypothetical protein ACLQUY_12175 [Ktedonobacterales bacterium]